jgi:hypothetical protein
VSVTTCPVPSCKTTDVDGNRLLITTPLCDHHRARLAQTIRDAPRTYTELALLMGSRTVGNSERVSTGETIRLPINTEARSLQQDLARTLAHAENYLRRRLGPSPAPPRGREGPTVQAAATWLGGHVDELLEHDDSAALELLDLRRRTDRLLGHSNPPIKLPTPCAACGCFALRRPAGSDDATCHACGQVHPLDAYHAHTRQLAEELAA